MRRVKAGRFGPVTAQEVAAFLDRVEKEILENIELKAEANPSLRPIKDERAAETREYIDRLRREYLP
ncbi:MAG: hypothetical protein IRY95_00170 [Clostridia bacterium]|nr:hypothetical protein [Clostridia bacterium]